MLLLASTAHLGFEIMDGWMDGMCQGIRLSGIRIIFQTNHEQRHPHSDPRPVPSCWVTTNSCLTCFHSSHCLLETAFPHKSFCQQWSYTLPLCHVVETDFSDFPGRIQCVKIVNQFPSVDTDFRSPWTHATFSTANKIPSGTKQSAKHRQQTVNNWSFVRQTRSHLSIPSSTDHYNALQMQIRTCGYTLSRGHEYIRWWEWRVCTGSSRLIIPCHRLVRSSLDALVPASDTATVS